MHGSPSCHSFMPRQVSLETNFHTSVTNKLFETLLKFVSETQQQGQNLFDAYSHFDKRNQGVVTVDDLMKAVVELRLCPSSSLWTEEDAEECIAELSRGKSRAHFTQQDFVTYFTTSRTRTKKANLLNSTHPTYDLKNLSKKSTHLQSWQEQAATVSHNCSMQEKAQLRKPLPEWAHARSKWALNHLECANAKPQAPLTFKRTPSLNSLSTVFVPTFNSYDNDNDTLPDDLEPFKQPPALGPQLDAKHQALTLASEKSDNTFVSQPSNRWQTFHVDAETTISYGILSNSTMQPATWNVDDDGAFSSQSSTTSTAQKDTVGLLNMAEFQLTVFIDAFQQLETLEAFFRPLLLQFPKGKILLCGFPTRSNCSLTWQNVPFARVHASLLDHVVTQTQEWLVQPKMGPGAVPQYLIGFGTGASTALQLLEMEFSTQAKSDSNGTLKLFVQALRGLVLINAVDISNVERKTLCAQQKAETKLQSENGLKSGDTAKLHEALASIEFSDHHLAQLAPLKNGDVTAAITNLVAVVPAPFALILIHGSQDALYSPHPVQLITEAIHASSSTGFSHAKSVSEALSLDNLLKDSTNGNSQCLHVAWLKGGHDLLQEQGPYFYELFRQLATASTSQWQPTLFNDNPSQVDQDNRSTLDATSLASNVTLHQTLRSEDSIKSNQVKPMVSKQIDGNPLSQTHYSETASTVRQRLADHLSTHGLAWIQQELYDRDIEGAGSSSLILERYERMLVQEEKCFRQQTLEKQRMLAKHEEIKAQRQAKVEKARKQEQRALEARQAVQRRERELEKHFYRHMEAKKRESARRVHENDKMMLEDLRSQKAEHFLDCERRRWERNRVAMKQMGELKAERQERLWHEAQVKSHALHLREQRVHCEALKVAQHEFEQKELGLSPVDAYYLDAPAVYERFDDIVSGARTLAADFGHCYKLKALQTQRRLELQSRQKRPLAAKEVKGHNLERIASNTPVEMQALGQELQRDAMLRRQELAWKDQYLQRVNVSIQRNERFRQIVLAKISLCVDTGNERTLALREENERLTVQRDKFIELCAQLKQRQAVVRSECERAQARSTAFDDTSVRVVGVPKRSVLVQELEEEDEALHERIKTLGEQEQAVQLTLETCKLALDEIATRTLALEECRRVLESPFQVEDIRLGHKPNANECIPQSGYAESVRLKKHVARSVEERQWVILDFLLNFAYYDKHVALEEVELIRNHADYQQKKENKLTVDDLQRLLQLPARNCLAFAFFKSPEEMEAHYLLRKYTFGHGEAYYAQQDYHFRAPDGVAAPRATLSSKLEHLCSILQKSSLRISQYPAARTALLSNKSSQLTLLHVPQTQIYPHKSITHNFQLPKTSKGVAVLTLTSSIVFQGRFKSANYQNGRLAAMMYMVPPVTDVTLLQQRIQAPIPIGKCFHVDDLTLSSPHCRGKLVLRHEPLAIPLSAAATYQIVIGAPIFTTYSLEVCGRTALFADEALRRKRIDALKLQALLPIEHTELQNVVVTIQLSDRKKRLARRLANKAKDQARTAELELLQERQKLERDNAVPSLNQGERRDLYTAIRAASKMFTDSCFLFSKREEEVRDIEQSLQELSKIHVDRAEDCKRMEQLLSEYRATLPRLAALLSTDLAAREAAAAKLAKELNTEYVKTSDKRSAKVRWAELSALKAEIPFMILPTERLRRKYKSGQDTLDKTEREWVILDRLLHPQMYWWEQDKHSAIVKSNPSTSSVKLWLYGANPKLSKSELKLATLSPIEVKRIMEVSWNVLERKEITIRKIYTQFRDDYNGRSMYKGASSASIAPFLRAQDPSELRKEEQEWLLYDQLLNPRYYPLHLKQSTNKLPGVNLTSRPVENVTVSPKLTREDLLMAIGTPDKELYKLPSDLLRGRTLLFKFDPQHTAKLILASQIQQKSQKAHMATSGLGVDVDARCRLVFHELQRALANTHSEFMDSSVLHSTLQRFPTRMLRLELENELDRLLISQIKEREEFGLANFLSQKDGSANSSSDEEAGIACQVELQRKAKIDAKQMLKARGKMRRQTYLQKQRRGIKNKLQKRNIDEQRLLQREQELGPGGCTACWTNPCQWVPFLEHSFVTLEERIRVIHEELDRVKHCPDEILTSTVCMAAVKSGDQALTLRKSDLFNELTLEVGFCEKSLRLKAVDEELHETFCSKNDFFETQALHGFRQIQHKNKVQIALQREHNALVAHLTAYEVVEDVLESMLEGWIFGERKSKRQISGFVPSLKREGPLTVHDLRRFEDNHRISHFSQNNREEEIQNAQELPSDNGKPVEVEAFQVDLSKKAVQIGSEVNKSLTETENVLRFGLFCMTLMYFRGLSLLKKQKTLWTVSTTKRRDAVDPWRSAERHRLDKEKKKAELRARKIADHDMNAQIGQARRQRVYEQKQLAYRIHFKAQTRTAKREKKAAIDIQRTYRGHLCKIAGKKWMLRRREINAQRALDHAAAISLQRAYRGRLGRIAAEERRVEFAELNSQLRAEEAIAKEKEYWRKHKIKRLGRNVVALVRKEA